MENGRVPDSCSPLPDGTPAPSGLSDFLRAAARKGYDVTILCQGGPVRIIAWGSGLRAAQLRGDGKPSEALGDGHPAAELVGRLAAAGMPVALQLSET